MANRPWYEDFSSWMLKRGILVRDVPREPMSESTVRVFTNTVKKAMRKVKVLGPKNEVRLRLREITPDHLINYFDVAYPKGPRGHESGWSHDARALKKFAEYLHWGTKWRDRTIFSKKELKRVKESIYSVTVQVDKPDLTEEFLNRYEHKFLPWLKEHRLHLWGPATFMLLTGLRIHEVSGIDVGLKKGSMIRLGNGDVEIEGKAIRGQKRHDPITLIDDAERHLKEWTRLRKTLHVESVALFPNLSGGRLPIEGGFNRAIRRAAKTSGLFEGDHDEEGNHATGELAMLHSHAIGRASFITRNTHDKVGTFDGMKLSRHKSIDVYQGYVRTDAKSAARRVTEARRNGHDIHSDQVDGSLKDMIISAIRELPPDEKKDLGRALLQELMA